MRRLLWHVGRQSLQLSEIGIAVRALALLLFPIAAMMAHSSGAQERVIPVFSIWEVVLGQPVSALDEAEVSEIACGTNGGPSAQILVAFDDFATCQPEPSGLREIAFSYDDEQDYIALALELEYKFLKGGTSIFAHPVVVSVLIDEAGIVQGRRIVTDDRISDQERRTAVTVLRNFKARYSHWDLPCEDVPMKDGEQPVGNQFIHELCQGASPDGLTHIAIEASYLRKKGQQALSQETQTINTGYFQSQTRYEEVLAPYSVGHTP
jgi:hypothetical protein